MSTYFVKPDDIKREWFVIDAEDIVLGRLASKVSMLLRGKHKPYFSSHLDCGDYVVIVNADKVGLKGKKRTKKTYYRHTGHPGGIKETTAEKILDGKHPERVIIKAVERMVARSPMGRKQMKKLKVYKGAEHGHSAQNPTVIDFGSENRKNKLS